MASQAVSQTVSQTVAGGRIRRALPADLPAIVAVEQACPEAPHWSHESWLAALAQVEGAHPARAVWVAAGEIGGGLGIVGVAVASCAGELSELESIAVSPLARRQGIGKALMRVAMDWAWGRGARSMELEVRASSDGPLALYRSLGFAEQGRRRAYYRNPVEDAVLMAAALPEGLEVGLPESLQAEPDLDLPQAAVRGSLKGVRV